MSRTARPSALTIAFHSQELIVDSSTMDSYV